MVPTYPIPAVCAILLNSQGQVLLTRRSSRVREPGKWCLPGGHLDGGETWSQAVVREVEEEVGVRLQTYELVGIYSDPLITTTPDPVHGRYGKEQPYFAQFVVASFLSKEWVGEITPNDEVDRYEWCHPNELPEPMLRSHPVRIEDAFQFQGRVFVR